MKREGGESENQTPKERKEAEDKKNLNQNHKKNLYEPEKKETRVSWWVIRPKKRGSGREQKSPRGTIETPPPREEREPRNKAPKQGPGETRDRVQDIPSPQGDVEPSSTKSEDPNPGGRPPGRGAQVGRERWSAKRPRKR